MAFKLDKDDIDQFEHIRPIRTVTVAAKFVLVIALGWIALGVYLGVIQIVWIATALAVATLISILMVQKGWLLIGRLFWYLSGLIAVCAGTFIIHPDGRVDLLYIAVIGGPFLSFSLKTERRYIIGMTLLVILCWLITQHIIGLDYFGPPVIDQETASRFVSPPVFLTTATVICMTMGIFGLLTDKYSESLKESRKAAEAANEAKSAFLATMSHEIRTPMNGVIGMVDLMLGEETNTSQKRNLSIIRSSSYALLRIIEDILDMSRIEAGRVDLQKEAVEVSPLLESVMDSLRAYADAKRVTLGLYIGAETPSIIETDPGRLRQILINLLGNAIKFSEPGKEGMLGHARLSADVDEAGNLTLEISDNGIGIEADLLPNLFEAFRQSQREEAKHFGGSGLGLAIVKELVDKMSGDISIDSSIGEGTTFRLHFPVNTLSASIPVPNMREVRPNLSGTSVVFFSTDQWEEQALFGLISDLGGICEICRSKSDLFEAAMISLPGTLFILSEKAGSTHSLSDAFMEHYPQHLVVEATRQRNLPLGKIGPMRMRIQASPILPEELLHALAELSGKKQNRVKHQADIISIEHPETVLSIRDASQTRILVAEDNEINRTVLESQLKRLGFAPHMAENGEAALKAWRQNPYDILLSDCHMPVLDGFGLAKEIRAEEAKRRLSRLPIIAITANALQGEAEKCRRSGMDDYLSKPVRLADLKAVIQRNIESSAA